VQGIIPNRDPRIDPQRGDMVRGNGQVRRVMAREGDRVRCESGKFGYRMRLDNWQKWCRLSGATAGQVAASSGGARKIVTAWPLPEEPPEQFSCTRPWATGR
jgi:hypothetical protein